jgi:hypothetical protein
MSAKKLYARRATVLLGQPYEPGEERAHEIDVRLVALRAKLPDAA